MSRDEDFRVFAKAHGPALAAAAYLLTGDHGHAEDLTQATLLEIFVSWSRVRSADNPAAYAKRIVYTTYLRQRRRQRVHEAIGTPPEGLAAPGQDSVDERDEMNRLLARLPPRQRAVIVLRYFEDMDIAATAKVLGCSTGTVKSQTAKALETLRNTPVWEDSTEHDRY